MAFENRYSFTDRTLHKLSFSTLQTQIDFSEMEERLLGKDLAEIENREPVFITALPRAGTTLLLDWCADLDEFATHCYRDMPFVLLPLFWNKFSSRFRKDDTPRERAHGDGMLVSVDSPEAFEEMIWKTWWRDQYKSDYIQPWNTNEDAEFRQYFSNHLKKITKLRQKSADTPARYISKNNANIARIEWLSENFSDAKFVVLFRDPGYHASSLLKQHIEFLEIHKQDVFARDYMSGIGHFDFGENLLPINFNDWLAKAEYSDPTHLGFWLEYWVNTYQHLLDQASDRIYFLSYDKLCEKPEHHLSKLADFLAITDTASFLKKSEDIRAGTTRDIDFSTVSESLIDSVQSTHRKLLAQAA